MAVRKFKFHLSEMPSSVHHKHKGSTVVKIQFPSKSGRKLLVLHDQQIVKIEDDPIAEHAIEHYRPPKIPIKHHPGGVAKHVYHDYEEHSRKRPFVEVPHDSAHDHEL